MAKDPTWTPESIAQLTSAQIVTLRDNAHKMHATIVVDTCEAELAKRNQNAPRSRRVPNKPLAIRNEEISAELVRFAKELATEYDLSKQTAEMLTGWMKGYRAHNLLGKNGKAKTGGLRKLGLCDLDTYISYRVKDVVISLGAWLSKGKPIEEIEYQLFAPEQYLENPLPYQELRPGLPMPAKGIGYGQRYLTLETAKADMKRILALMNLPNRHD